MKRLFGTGVTFLLYVTSLACSPVDIQSDGDVSPLVDAGFSDVVDAETLVSTDGEIPTDGLVHWFDGHGIVVSSFEIEDGLVLVEGHVVLGSPADVFSDDTLIRSGELTEDQLKNTWDVRRRRQWGGSIGFRIDGSATAGNRADILAAVAAWNAVADRTGLSWVEVPDLSSRSSGVLFRINDEGRCRAEVGRFRRARTEIFLDRAGCFSVETISHEMGHVIGMHHTQTRDDRGRWIHYLSRNNLDERQADQHPFLPRRYREVGDYDEASLMQYFTAAFGTLVNFPIIDDMGDLAQDHRHLPVYQSRLRLALWTRSGEPPEPYRRALWNDHVLLDNIGISLGDMLVRDVDSDGVDDLITELDGELYWNAAARGGWRALSPDGGGRDGAPLRTALDQVAIGDFNGDDAYDVLVIDGGTWTLHQAGEPAVSREVAAIRDVEVGDFNGDDVDDILVVNRDRSWSVGFGPDVLDLSPWGQGDMEVDDVTVVTEQRFGVAFDCVVGFPRGFLSVAAFGETWRPVPTAERLRGDNVRSLDQVWFGEIDGASGLDLLTWSPENRLRVVDDFYPVFVNNVLESAHYLDRVPIGIRGDWIPDLAAGEVLFGRFSPGAFSSFLTLDDIPYQTQIARSDWTSVASRYGTPEVENVAILSHRYPNNRENIADPTLEYTTSDIGPRERVQLRSTFLVKGVRRPSYRIVTERMRQDGTFEEVANNYEVSIDNGDSFSTAHFAYLTEPGRWRVQIVPTEPSPMNSEDVPVWNFVVGGACGDGFLDSGETCDDGNTNNMDACVECQPARCGDGFVWSGQEACDDGNDSDVDDCTTMCTVPFCGDGLIQRNERCDDGNMSTTDACVECQPAVCGDGFVHMGVEECDDGNRIADDECTNGCTSPRCGDGVRQMNEDCDTGLDSRDCNADCSVPVCGDGVLNTRSGEACDDGNTNDADACDNSCTLTSCGDGVVQAGEDCDSGGVDSAGCNANCTFAVCGDGYLNGAAGEVCDSGGADTADCDGGDCSLPSCGDFYVNRGAGEACDRGGMDSPTCNADCTSSMCGDGYTNMMSGEECDNGSSNSDVLANACRTDCREAFCGDGIVDMGEDFDTAMCAPITTCVERDVSPSCRLV